MSRHVTAYRVKAGTYTAMYFTSYHAEQMADALRRHRPLDGVPVTVEPIRLPDDPLTRLTVRA